MALQIEGTSLPQAPEQHGNVQSLLFLVADGMGGHAAGEHASALAVASVEAFLLDTFQWFAQLKAGSEDRILAEFQSALGQANARVLAEAAEHPRLRGMGTTLTLGFSLDEVLFVAHVGDSRCYLFRDRLHRLTHDHTLVEEMVREGTITPGEAVHHRLRHVITNVVGGDKDGVKVEVHKVRLEAGDTILLCTDGLSGMVPDREITEILQTAGTPDQACRKLVARANEAGGRDNVTVIVAQYQATHRAGN